MFGVALYLMVAAPGRIAVPALILISATLAALLQAHVLPKATFSFSGTSWAEHDEGGPVTSVNHHGYFLSYVETPQPNGSVRRSAALYAPKLLSTRLESNRPPVFAGSFWFDQQRDFVESHAQAARLAGSQSVNNVECAICDLDVEAADVGQAFNLLVPQLKDGGTLRLYIAPKLGHVLPRIECISATGEIVILYEATDFVEFVDGLTFPKRIRQELRGKTTSWMQFDIEPQNINEQIPEADFVVHLPVGSEVMDSRRA